MQVGQRSVLDCADRTRSSGFYCPYGSGLIGYWLAEGKGKIYRNIFRSKFQILSSFIRD